MITAADLKKSAVVFDEASHTYRRGSAELSGITGLIRSVLRLGVYPDASLYVQEVRIPKAGYYGICLHKAIQVWEELGVENTHFPEVSHTTKHFGDIILPAQDVSEDLLYYRKVKPRVCRTLVSEFTVDYGNFASQIDAVWQSENGEIYLVDHKTNNLDYYPGGAAKLKEYLSWQLSCYAVMFEVQTGRLVHGLLGNWIRKGAGELWRIPRRDDDEVLKLLSTEILPTDNGFVYINPEMQVTAPKLEKAVEPVSSALAVPTDIITAIANLLKAEKAAKVMKEKLREMMEAAGISKWECDQFTATIGKPSESRTFDTKAFQADHPDLYEQYIKTTSKKGSFTQKLK